MLVSMDRLAAWRRAPHGTVVATNGCFDVLHVGHLRCLEGAATLGAVLIVGINSDAAVRQLKGRNRPINNQADRAEMLQAMWCVDAVCVFDDVKATEFLRLCRPHVYIKGGDYNLAKLDPEERAALEDVGAKIHFVPTVPNRSTTSILQRLGG